MKRILRRALLRVLVLAVLAGPVWADTAVVRAVLFYSPSCPHCHQVLNESLQPLAEKYGEQLQLAGVDVTQAGGLALFQSAAERYGLEQMVVPTLIVGDVVLIGSVEIPEKLPSLIESYLARGGVDWPDIPGLAEALVTAQPTPTLNAGQPTPASSPTAGSAPTAASAALNATTVATASPHPTPTAPPSGLSIEAEPPVGLRARLARDPAGNALAIGVLAGMVFTVGYVGVRFRRRARRIRPAWHERAFPILCLIGAGIAGYLAYVETAQVTAVCGPVGDCNTVQQSEYAWLFGLFPVGVLGLVGYVVIGIAWCASHYGRGPWAEFAAWALAGLTLFGTLFSIYLTFLEPFVIGATCAWCLTSAVIMTALLYLTATPEKGAAATHLKPRWR